MDALSTILNDTEASHFNDTDSGRFTDSDGSLSENGSGQPQQPDDYHDEDDDDMSGEVDRPYNGYFEGPEKTLELCFRPVEGCEMPMTTPTNANPGERTGLRLLERCDLDRICRRARCTIISSVSNQFLDAYVLSESSLFVYPNMMVLKTCGTTTLLRCISTVIELTKKIGLELDWVGYSRKNFSFPGDQCFPHQSFNQEVDYLASHRRLSKRLNGSGYTLGPVTGDHWYVFIADQTLRNSVLLYTDRVLNIMMFDIDQTVAKIFYYDQFVKEGETEEEAGMRIGKLQTKKAGIDSLCPGAIIDPRAFQPCGYSMNAILFHSYCTMHITPEDGSSYASFETNQKLGNYTSLINNVINAFKPKRFVMTLMADEDGLDLIKTNPLTENSRKAAIMVRDGKDMMTYKRRSTSSIKVDDCCCMMGNWNLEEERSTNKKIRGYSIDAQC